MRLPPFHREPIADPAVDWDIWTGYAEAEAERLVGEAQAAAAAGNTAGAEALALQALQCDANAMLAHVLLAELRLPGPSYLDWLASIHRAMRPRTYVEIGVADGLSLRLTLPGCRVIAIDPRPRLSFEPDPRDVTLLRLTSQAFFAGGAAEALLEPTGFDLAFVDGCHAFEQVLRDFACLERFAAPGAVICMHDTMPLDEVIASCERRTTFYAGDAWKVVALLHQVRTDLRLRTIATAPTGLTLVHHLAPDSVVLWDRYAELVHDYQNLAWSDYLAGWRAFLHPAANDAAALDFLAAARQPGDRSTS